MKPAFIDDLRETVRRQPTRLGLLHAQMRDAGSEWSPEQIRLLFETFDGFRIGDPASANPEVSLGEITPEEALAAAVRQILSSEPGRPLPLARVIELLPANLTTSAEQLRAMAAVSTDLEVRGALIRLKPNT